MIKTANGYHLDCYVMSQVAQVRIICHRKCAIVPMLYNGRNIEDRVYTLLRGFV